MALDFPASPALNQVFLAPNGASWRWDGAKWVSSPQATPADITVADAPPALVAGKLWWDSTGGQLYVGYDDGVGAPQWVAATNLASFAAQAGSNNVGRNLIHNPLFNVAQRGTGPFSTSAYTVDRWRVEISLDSTFVSQAPATDTTRAMIGDEAISYFVTAGVTGNAGAASYTGFRQPVEDVRRLAGKTIILSFWAAANAGTPKIGASIDQYFGTGGTTPPPSAVVPGAGQSVTISTTWARYSLTFTVPSITGKTLGTANDHCTNVWLWFSGGATIAPRAGNIGVQTANFNIWGIQLEVAQPGQTQPTSLEKPDPQQDLAKCQRFYQTGAVSMYAYNVAGAYVTQMLPLPVTMRALPVVTPTLTPANLTGATMDAQGYGFVRVVATATATGACNAIGTYTASADL